MRKNNPVKIREQIFLKMKLYCIGSTILLQLLATNLDAQRYISTVRGQVTDAEGPLSGVSVKVQGATTGVFTDSKGNYSIPVSNSSQAFWHCVLIFTYHGYESQAIWVKSHRTINVVLTEKSDKDEVIPFPSPQLITGDGGIYSETSRDLDRMKYHFTRPPDNPVPPGDIFNPLFTGEVAMNPPVISEYTIEAKEDRSINTLGMNFSVSGNNGKDTRVWMYRQTTASDSRLYNPDLVRSRDDYLICTVEEGEPYGMYLMWIENENGAGYPVRINAPEMTWVGPDHAVPGSSVSVYGQNLSHNNDTTESHVFIRPWGSGPGVLTTEAPVSGVNPYKVTFTLPADVSAGADYEVWVHNGHGGRYGWSGPMKLHADPSDPYVWNGAARDVKDFGAAGNGTADDSKAIQDAIDAAADGDRIIFPAGIYRLADQSLNCNKKLSFEGAGTGYRP
jgi:hypothetical protein